MLGRSRVHPNGERAVVEAMYSGSVACTSTETRLAHLDDLWFYASAVGRLCPREVALAVQGDAMFHASGCTSSVEERWQARLRASYRDAVVGMLDGLHGVELLGSWRWSGDGAPSGVSYVTGPQPAQHPSIERGWCPRPDGGRWRYVAPKIRDFSTRCVGRIDAVLRWDGAEEVVVVKPVSADELRRIGSTNAVLPDDVDQAQVYLWQTGLPRARVLYVGIGLPMLHAAVVEAVVWRDERRIDMLSDRLRSAWRGAQDAWEVLAARRRGERVSDLPEDRLPPRMVECSDAGSDRRRRCGRCDG